MDTFFSGSSDVALPERGGRRTGEESPGSGGDLEARAPYFCERCDESIPLSELAAGRARIVYGLAFCVRCAPLLEEDRFQVYSCDRCGASIPLDRIAGGEALAGDGHVYCERCRRRPSRPVRVARRAALPAAVVLLLLGVAAGLVLAPRRPPPARPDLDREIRAVRVRLERPSPEEGAGELVRAIEEERARLADVLGRGDDLSERLRRLEEVVGVTESAQPRESDRR